MRILKGVALDLTRDAASIRQPPIPAKQHEFLGHDADRIIRRHHAPEQLQNQPLAANENHRCGETPNNQFPRQASPAGAIISLRNYKQLQAANAPRWSRFFVNVDKNKQQVADMLRTERLDLREFTIDDFEAVHAYASDPLVTRFTSFGPNTPQETQDFLSRSIAAYHQEPRRSHVFGIVDRNSGQLFGSCGLEACDATGLHFSFGYCLHRDWWGRGFGSEAAAALVDFAFEQLEAHRLWAHVFVGNPASARILEGLGFRQEGIALQSAYVRNAWHDLITYARLSFE